MTRSKPVPNDESFEALTESLRELASTIVDAHERMAAAWEPIVQGYISSHSTDVNAMQLTLDYLLGCACQAQGLALYRRLCRYLWSVDPAAAAYAVNAYREMWDPDEERPWATPAPSIAPAVLKTTRPSPKAKRP